MKFELLIFYPGGTFDKHGDPIPTPPEITTFEARTATEALDVAIDKYKQTGLKHQGHFNIGLVNGSRTS